MAEQRDSDDAANQKLVAGLRLLCSDLKVPSPSEFGIDAQAWQQSLELMTQQAQDSGSPNNNPRIPSATEIKELYQKVWGN
jgi:alcohol dehydrogenase class IV